MSTAARRTRYGLLAVVLIAAATVSLAIANLLASRYSTAWDVTATRAQELSPRTRNLLSELDAPYEIVLAVDSRRVERSSREQVGDVLAAFERASPHLRATRIDTASAAGAAEYRSFLARLRDRDAAKIAAQTARVRETLDKTDDIARGLAALATPMLAVRDAMPEPDPAFTKNRDAFMKWAASAGDAAQSLAALTTAPRNALAATASTLGVPNLEPAVLPLRKYLTELEPGLADVAEKVRTFSKDGVATPAARDLARPIAAALEELRTRAALAADALRLERLDLARVAAVLETQEAAIVVGPPGKGVTAIPVSWLFPPVDTPGGMRADVGRRAEDLFAVAVESLARPAAPVVVLIHGTPSRAFTQAREYQGMIQRLGLRGIDLVEWATVLDPEPPSTREADPTGKRPVVYVVLSTSPLTSHQQYTGPARVEALGHAISRIVQDGAPLLLSITPSDLPTYGQKDPTVAALPLFGLEADSARPIIRAVLTPQGRQVAVDQALVAVPGPTPVHGAVKNLRTVLEWAIPLRPAPGWAGPPPQPLYRVESNNGEAWAESQWRDLWVTMHSTRGAALPELPTPDSSRDDTQGPWTVAATCSRVAPSTGKPQRLVVIGANDWFQDGVTEAQAQNVDGRSVRAFPGNAELLEASIYWLAGQDERVAPSPTARAVAVIGPLGPGTRSALRWLVLAGLPGGALLLGAIWRAVRG
ncbi:MAG: hypothetical protein IT437_00210 [Phycisphaerales bacterium]|nr:hypothetical protein [Phycisphaerales bacterium]